MGMEREVASKAIIIINKGMHTQNMVIVSLLQKSQRRLQTFGNVF